MLIYLQIIETKEDKSKFEILYMEYRQVMYHTAYEILKNQEDAEDAVHQAFVRIAEKIKEVDGTICNRTKGFVITIVQNIAFDQIRRAKKFAMVEFEDQYAFTIPYYGTNQLTACMAKLPPNYRAVFLLKDYQGYTTKETAKFLGISESNVLKISQRARKRLEELLRDEDILV